MPNVKGHRNDDWGIAMAVSVVAIVASLVFSFLVFPLIKEPLQLNLDPDNAGQLAANIAEGRGYVYNDSPSPAVDRGPVYPYLLAALFRVAGSEGVWSVLVFQALCHGMTVFVVFLISGRLLGRQTAVVASLLCAIHPMLIWYTSRIWIETVHSLAIVIVAWTVVRLFASPSSARAIVTGLAIGVASLTKSVLLLFPFVAGVFVLARFGKKGILPAVLVVAGTALVVAPWTVRNYTVTGSFVPVHTSLGLNMIQGDAIGEYWTQVPYSTLDIWHKGARWTDSLLAGTGYTPADPTGDRLLVVSSVNYNISRPVNFVRRVATNALTFWYLSESFLKSAVLFMLQLPVVLMVLVFGVRFWRTTPGVRPILLLILYYAIVHVFVVGWARYSAPIVPLCLLVVSAGITPVILRLPDAKSHTAAITGDERRDN